MKKQMLDRNLRKLSEEADRSLTDTAVATVLICYLLKQVREPLDPELLYDISVTGNVINYFTYQESLAILLQNGSVELYTTDKGHKRYRVTQKGIECSESLKSLTGKSYRDQLLDSAHHAIERFRNEKDLKVEYISLESGYHLHVTLMDNSLKLMELTFFAPDSRQAHLLGDHILSNPSEFYHNVLRSAMENPHKPNPFLET